PRARPAAAGRPGPPGTRRPRSATADAASLAPPQELTGVGLVGPCWRRLVAPNWQDLPSTRPETKNTLMLSLSFFQTRTSSSVPRASSSDNSTNALLLPGLSLSWCGPRMRRTSSSGIPWLISLKLVRLKRPACSPLHEASPARHLFTRNQNTNRAPRKSEKKSRNTEPCFRYFSKTEKP